MLLEEKTKAFFSAQAGKVLTPSRVFPADWLLKASSVELATQCLGRSDTLLRDPTTAGDAVPWHRDRRALP